MRAIPQFFFGSIRKKREVNPKSQKLSENHHISLETESREFDVLFKKQVFSFKHISIQWESDKIIVNITSGTCQARDRFDS